MDFMTLFLDGILLLMYIFLALPQEQVDDHVKVIIELMSPLRTAFLAAWVEHKGSYLAFLIFCDLEVFYQTFGYLICSLLQNFLGIILAILLCWHMCNISVLMYGVESWRLSEAD